METAMKKASRTKATKGTTKPRFESFELKVKNDFGSDGLVAVAKKLCRMVKRNQALLSLHLYYTGNHWVHWRALIQNRDFVTMRVRLPAATVKKLRRAG
jgi:hypothetical protein